MIWFKRSENTNRSHIALLLLLLPVLLTICLTAASEDVLAETAKDRYFKAERCYKKFRGSPPARQIRERWLVCIDAFQDVYRMNANGPWAAAGLYMSGKLYWELYRELKFEPDKTEAIDIFDRIVKRYPDSRYKQRAIAQKAAITRSAGEKSSKKAKTDKAGDPKQAYLAAERCYRELRADPRKQKYRDRWIACIDRFDSVYRIEPAGPWAAAGLYKKAALYEELYRHSFNSRDLRSAAEIYQLIIDRYAHSRYHEKALSRRSQICGKVIACETAKPGSSPVADRDPISGVIAAAATGSTPKAEGRKSDGQCTTVSGIRYWSNPSYTRVVIDADHPAAFNGHLLKKDPSLKKPPRLYVDLSNSRLGNGLKKTIPIDDNLLRGVRAGQYTNDTVRVVVDIKSFQSYKLFPLREPFRIVIDVWGDEPDKQAEKAKARQSADRDNLPAGSLARQLALGVNTVVIDPGHGGKDPGAVGPTQNALEKNVNLSIARKLAEKIRRELKCNTILTRNSDRYLTLEERTAIANTKNADLFISIHANAHRNRNVYGIETFFLNLATDDESIRVAARENATSTKNISDLQSILSDLMQNAKINESSRLAAFVQEAMCRDMGRKYSYIKNNGVKQAPFYVLLGAQMPAILIETSFISNPRECGRLINQHYQDHICEAIVRGVKAYITETNPNKLSNINQKSGTTG
ncbi:MAG: N-acetylmuramoyl-L-alanine amidase [Desulfobacterales bacterium]